jgi:sulfatase maturation enzyme AslB (radical SAM superfamily)
MRLLDHQSYFIELTNHCNMHCSFCPSDELKKQRRTADEDIVDKYIRQIAELNADSCLIHFNVLGEPLLNKQIFKYIELCNELGVRCCVITNLTLLTQKNIDKLLSFHNLLLVLSLQTPTVNSYKIRGYKHMDFDAYMATIEQVILAKFRLKSEASIEVHIAGAHTPPNLFRESGKPLWSIYADEAEQNRVLRQMIEGCQAISLKAQALYAEFYNSATRPDHGSEDYRPLLENPNVLERDFWGWMFAPNVFFRVKEFGLWALQEAFLKKFLEPTEAIFIENAEGSFVCSMAEKSFSMLADGQFTACCLDYDGEIDFGNIEDKTASQAFWSIDRSALIADAFSNESCRRCQGKAYMFDTSPISAAKYEVKMLGRGWYDYEPDLYNRGGCWTNGTGTFYLYGRAFIPTITLEMRSMFPTGTEAKLVIAKLVGGKDRFDITRELIISLDSETVSRIAIPVNLPEGCLYRMQLISPSFIPCAVQNNTDKRHLGLAVFGIEATYIESRAAAVKPRQKRTTSRILDRTLPV